MTRYDAGVDLPEFADEAVRILGDNLVALYKYGASFARGPKAKKAHLLLVVDNLGTDILRDIRPLARQAQDANYYLRVDTLEELLCCADVFPIFVLELIDTKSLMKGNDVLAELQVHPEHLRARVEQSLRAMHRELLSAFVADESEERLVADLRRVVRKSVYVLRALARVRGVDLPTVPSAEQLIETVIADVLPNADRAIWHRLRLMANFEETVMPEGLPALYNDALAAFSQLVRAVDQL